MVHALEQIHRLLTPSGVLIDIHPHPEPEAVAVLQAGNAVFSEPMDEAESEDVLAAEHALNEVVRRGLFVTDRAEEFEFITHASSADELRDFWTEVMAFDDRPADAAELEREQRIYARLELARQAAGDGATVAMMERCQMTRLTPVG